MPAKYKMNKRMGTARSWRIENSSDIAVIAQNHLQTGPVWRIVYWMMDRQNSKVMFVRRVLIDEVLEGEELRIGNLPLGPCIAPSIVNDAVEHVKLNFATAMGNSHPQRTLRGGDLVLLRCEHFAL